MLPRRWSDPAAAAAVRLLSAYVKGRGGRAVQSGALSALRAGVRANLASRAAAPGRADPASPQIAEVLELRALLLIGDIDGARQRGDGAAEAVARDAFADWAQDVYGIGVREVRLTARGFVKR